MSNAASRRHRPKRTVGRSLPARDATSELGKLLSAMLPHELVTELLDHYATLTTAFRMGDWEKALLRGGKLAETVMKLVRFVRTGDELKGVSVEAEIQAAGSDASLPPELRTLVPRHARVLYDHRSKRGGGHGSFTPIEMDATVVASVACWVLAEFVRLYGQQDADTAHRTVMRLVRHPMPLVEEIGDDLLVVDPTVSLREEVGLLLSREYPRPMPRPDLKAWLRQGTDAALRTVLTRMRQDRLIHDTSGGTVLTRRGLAWASDIARRAGRN